MNLKPIIAAIAIGSSTAAALAFEATQFEDAPSTRTREEVRAELEQARRDGTLMSGGEATVFVDRPVATAPRERTAPQANVRIAAHDDPFGPMYLGSL
ncbi:MAG TPA: DUF4148 domain-containing protein [Albitalea sp.]|uniref:DUF4148 domain-containing protein n=1 Tax=Piscinibacter sp. TaxID=1903157 RepID=UPI002ED5A966